MIIVVIINALKSKSNGLITWFIIRVCMSEATHESSELENYKQLVSNFIEDVLTKHNNNIAVGWWQVLCTKPNKT